MATDYASKFSDKVDERFALGAMSGGVVNNAYDWIGVETVNVYSVGTVGMNDYSATGTSRYGTPSELEATAQEMKVTKDRSFTFTIDRKGRDDTQMALEAGKALKRQVDQRVIPEVDTYRFGKLAAGATTTITGAVSKTTAYEVFLNAQEKLDDLEIPTEGRVCVCTPAYHKLIKLDENFTKKGDLATQIAIKGFVGEIDGVPTFKVPKKRLPTGVNFIITHPEAMTSPVKLESYKIHEDPPGISGWLVEGRVRYDAFVLNQKKDAIAVHKTAT